MIKFVVDSELNKFCFVDIFTSEEKLIEIVKTLKAKGRHLTINTSSDPNKTEEEIIDLCNKAGYKLVEQDELLK